MFSCLYLFCWGFRTFARRVPRAADNSDEKVNSLLLLVMRMVTATVVVKLTSVITDNYREKYKVSERKEGREEDLQFPSREVTEGSDFGRSGNRW